jgi:F-type H+-transporting ATPase subunit beta
MLDGTGNPLDGLGNFPDPTRQPVFGSIKAPPSPILETGIKALDLFAPFKRGGQVGIDLCLGTGRLILTEQIARNAIALHDSRVVYLGLPEKGPPAPAIQYGEWWDGSSGDGKVLRENMVFVLGQARDSVSKRQQLAETGLTLAEAFRQQGHDVLLIVEGQLAVTDAVVPYLRSCAVATPEAAITTLYLGDPPVGLESEVFADLDAVVSFDPVRARQGLYPALDPVSSRSTLFQSNLLSSAHKEIAERARECLHRYYSWNLHHAYEARGLDCLYLDDGKATAQVILRARRLDRFLTQPFHGTERWLCVPGETVSIEDTLRGCQEILDSEHDDLPENAFYFVGAIDQALEKAKSLP